MHTFVYSCREPALTFSFFLSCPQSWLSSEHWAPIYAYAIYLHILRIMKLRPDHCANNVLPGINFCLFTFFGFGWPLEIDVLVASAQLSLQCMINPVLKIDI